MLGIPAYVFAIGVTFNDMVSDHSGLDAIAVSIAVVGIVVAVAVILKNSRPS